MGTDHQRPICLGLQKPYSPATPRVGTLASKALNDQPFPHTAQTLLPGSCDLEIRLFGSKQQRTNLGDTANTQRKVLIRRKRLAHRPYLTLLLEQSEAVNSEARAG